MVTTAHKPKTGEKIDPSLVLRSGVVGGMPVAWVIERIPNNTWVRLRVFWNNAIYHYRNYRYLDNAKNALNNVVLELRKKEGA